ncbi:MAG: alpha-amylase [Lachnospiraceae bacterium]|nr:alpha-amylase [Lachnospiraceae bacterium]
MRAPGELSRVRFAAPGAAAPQHPGELSRVRFALLYLILSLMASCAKTEGGNVKNETPKALPTGAVYEIFVGSFADSDGDGVGDLKGIEEKLDYLVDLGVSEIWITPIHPSPSYHHYDVIDYLAVDPAFGTMEDMDALLKAVHEKGMRLYLDLVINHTSSQHPWTKEHPEWYAEKNFFGAHMPELDLDNSEVREEIWKIVAFWLGKGVDGFRLDAALHYYEAAHEQNTSFLFWLNDAVKGIKPDAYIVAEVWTDFSYIKNYYASGVDSFFDFGLSDATGDIASAVKNKKGALLAQRMADHVNTIGEIRQEGIDAVFLSNHDQARNGGYYAREEFRRLAAAVLVYAPGKPFLYYGEEIGMRGSGRDENKRMAMQWGEGDDCLSPADCDYTAQITDTVKSEAADNDSLYQHYRALLRKRAEYPWLSEGCLRAEAVDLSDPALFCLRVWDGRDESNEVLILHNFSDQTKTVSGARFALPDLSLQPYASELMSIVKPK